MNGLGTLNGLGAGFGVPGDGAGGTSFGAGRVNGLGTVWG